MSSMAICQSSASPTCVRFMAQRFSESVPVELAVETTPTSSEKKFFKKAEETKLGTVCLMLDISKLLQ